MVGTIGTAAAAGLSYILKYNKNHYDRKISELEGYANMLKQHLGYMEELRDKAKLFWNDSEAETYYKSLNTEIRGVRNAIDRVDRVKIMYSDISDEFFGAKSEVGDLVSEAASLISGLGIEE